MASRLRGSMMEEEVMVYDNVLEAMGHTPLIRLRHIPDENCAQILVKFEALNVGGSIKTRTAYNMILQAERRGEIAPGKTTIIEPTSGNQGIGLALVGAVRGYDVRIIMPGVPDKKVVFRMAHGFYPALLEAGVKIYEYTPGFVHAKSFVSDDKVATIGTVNLDYRSLFLHFENNSLFYRSGIVARVKEDFLATQAKCSERSPYDRKQYSRRWVVDGILRIFAPLC